MAVRAKRAGVSEKGLLTPDNCVFAFVDLQPQLLLAVANFDRGAVIDSNAMLAKVARALRVPVVLSAVGTGEFGGDLWPRLREMFPGKPPIARRTMNPWDDPEFVGAIERTGRRRIVLAGLWTKTSVAFTAVQALHDGYEVFVAEDCCGDTTRLSHDNAMKRMVQAGAKPVTALSVTLELHRDWAVEGAYSALMEIIKTHAGSSRFAFEGAAAPLSDAAVPNVADDAAPRQ